MGSEGAGRDHDVVENHCSATWWSSQASLGASGKPIPHIPGSRALKTARRNAPGGKDAAMTCAPQCEHGNTAEWHQHLVPVPRCFSAQGAACMFRQAWLRTAHRL